MLPPDQESPSRRLALILLLGLPVLLFWPALVGGKMLWGPDIQTLQLVFATSARRALALGQLPHWTPELLGGMPGIAGSNLLFWHPVELGLALLGLPPWAVFGLDSALQVAAGGLGLYALARRLGLSRGAALLGAVAFALSGTQLSLLYPGHINNSKAVAMIPWVFWGALKGWQERRWLGWALAGAALALQVLGLGLQVFAYTLIALGGFVLWLALGGKEEAAKPRLRAAALGLSVCGAFAFALAAPQLLPSLEYKPFSWREGFDYQQFISWSFHPKEALGWIVPGFYGWREPHYHGDWPFCLTTEYFGLLPWMLAFAALAAAWQREPWRERLRRPEAFFCLLALFAFLSGIGKHFPLHHLYYRLPVYSGFRTWTRFLNVLTFAVCVLAAFGWDALLRAEGERLRRAKRGALAFAGLALLTALAALGGAPGASRDAAAALTQKLGPQGPAQALALAQASAFKAGTLALILLAGLAAWGRLRARAAVLLGAALLLHGFDAAEVARRFLEFRSPAEALARPAALGLLPDPQGPEPYRVWDPQGAWTQNTAGLFGYEATQGYHGVQMSAPMKLQQSLAQRQLDWLALTNTRFIISPQALNVPADWRDLSRGSGPHRVYEFPGAWPRARLMGRPRTVATDDEAFAAMKAPDFDPEQVLLTGAAGRPSADLSGGPLHGTVAFTRRTPNRLRLRATPSRPALLVLSQTWYPAWKARVNGEPAPVLKAYGGALTALELPAGEADVELWYRPTALYLGLALALAALLGPLAWVLRTRFGRKP